LALRHKSLPAAPDVLPMLSGSTELSGVGEVQFYVEQDTVYVVDEKIEVCNLATYCFFHVRDAFEIRSHMACILRST
jgi:hypothetical protein